MYTQEAASARAELLPRVEALAEGFERKGLLALRGNSDLVSPDWALHLFTRHDLLKILDAQRIIEQGWSEIRFSTAVAEVDGGDEVEQSITQAEIVVTRSLVWIELATDHDATLWSIAETIEDTVRSILGAEPNEIVVCGAQAEAAESLLAIYTAVGEEAPHD